MKQETNEIITQATTPKKKSDLEILSISYFYNLFSKEKKKYAPSLFSVNKTVKEKRKRSVEYRLFKKIILEYLKVYFFDFYINKKYLYFPLGGFLKKVFYPKWIGTFNRGTTGKQKSGSEGAIGLFWYMRPSRKMYYMVTIKKLTGSSNHIPKIEAIFDKRLDKDLLPIFITEIRKAQKHKTLFTCTLT